MLKPRVENRGAGVPQSADLSHVEFTLDGKLQELGRMAEEIAWFCEENDLDAEVEFDLNLAMEELFTNALRHGGCEGMEEAVRIRLDRIDNHVDARFSDRGRDFDPATVPPPAIDLPLADRSLGGLGLHLVRRAMGDLAWRRSGGWNHVSMRRPV